MGARLLPRTLPELFSYALAIEGEAAKRYRDLGGFMRAIGVEDLADELERLGREEEEQHELIRLGTSGRKLPDFPEAWKTEEHRLHGCQSMVWIVPSGDAAKLDFAAISDSAIVSGLVFLALRVYSGRPAAEILATQPDYIAAIGLAKHLSPTRSNGLAALLAFIRDTAQRAS